MYYSLTVAHFAEEKYFLLHEYCHIILWNLSLARNDFLLHERSLRKMNDLFWQLEYLATKELFLSHCINLVTRKLILSLEIHTCQKRSIFVKRNQFKYLLRRIRLLWLSLNLQTFNNSCFKNFIQALRFCENLVFMCSMKLPPWCWCWCCT